MIAIASEDRAAAQLCDRPLNAEPAVVLRRHPRGGWTHAKLIIGTARIYCGSWPTKAAARAAL